MASPPSAKRRKTTRACDCCRAQKKRCTGTIPCDSCVRNSKECTFLASYTRGRAVTPPPSSISVSVITPTPTPSNTNTNTFRSTSPRRNHNLTRSSSHPRTTYPDGRPPQPPATVSSTQLRPTWASLPTPSELNSVQPAPDEVSEPASDEVLPGSHFAGPGSAHTWMKQAWSCLGRVRQHVFRLHSKLAASAAVTRPDGPIFSHGDRALKEDQILDVRLPRLSDSTIDLILSYYFDRGLATYRFLHRPTVTSWLQDLQRQDDGSSFPPVRSAIVLLLLALGSSYLWEVDKARLSAEDAEVLRDEVLFYRAVKCLREERGAPSVESVQARLMQVHYLLTTSRPNRAWYAFGTVVQLVFALGLHQKTYTREDTPGLSRELRRRTFWSVYKTDKSLSIALGRPSLIREECITQNYPEVVNDEQVFADHIKLESDDDCLMEADVLTTKLSRIVGRSMREYYETDDDALIQLIVSNNERLADWKLQLPPFLSGAIKLSSLIPVLRRQATVIKIFHLHTVIFVNRPLLLKSFSKSWSLQQDHQIQSSIEACISAATEIAKQAVQFNIEGQAFRAFWFSQNMTFNAVTILYLNSLRLLQEKSALSEKEQDIVSLAEEAQKSLTNASEQNAPGLRYGIVLEQLRLEVRAHLSNGGSDGFPVEPRIEIANQGTEIDNFNAGQETENIEWTNVMSETPLNDASMFWPQFDGLPLGFDDWLATDFMDSMTGYVV